MQVCFNNCWRKTIETHKQNRTAVHGTGRIFNYGLLRQINFVMIKSCPFPPTFLHPNYSFMTSELAWPQIEPKIAIILDGLGAISESPNLNIVTV
jgi:hypothetical protein